ncbi:response regulator [uncultured Sulfitobacter sp.]|uniref:response regulator n=1 Tax=uncultured Sulfitobacter sp. TaxID=191468 RepID=UPI0026308C2D|nr:response regulator [uncultured Sulfitobacter sp.]
MRILAVDDDPVMLDLLGTALEQSGFDDITFAATAEDALELIDVAAAPYDIFLLDVMLPGTSGIEVCRTVRTYPRYRATPVLMITGSRARDMMTRAFEAGATDFVSKPFDALELVTRIKLAAMLNDSMQREQMNAAALEELGQLTEVSFDERFDLPSGAGVKGFLTLENELLRRADALYEMVLFTVEIDNALGLYRGSRPAQFRASVEAVGRALSSEIDTDNTRFAYAGRGDMIGVAHTHAQIDLRDLQRRANQALAVNWDSFASGQPKAPTLSARRIDGPPAWSGKAAADVLRSFQGRADLTAQADPYEVDGLFERLSVRISGQ